MGFRFRKSIQVLPGIRLNLSKSGVSTSIGKPGASVNIGERGARGTVGIPGTGITYSEKLSESGSTHTSGMGFAAVLAWGLVALMLFLVLYGLLRAVPA